MNQQLDCSLTEFNQAMTWALLSCTAVVFVSYERIWMLHSPDVHKIVQFVSKHYDKASRQLILLRTPRDSSNCKEPAEDWSELQDYPVHFDLYNRMQFEGESSFARELYIGLNTTKAKEEDMFKPGFDFTDPYGRWRSIHRQEAA